MNDIAACAPWAASVEPVEEVEDEEDDEEPVLLTPNAANAFSMACRKFEPLFFMLLDPLSSLLESFPVIERELGVDCKLDRALTLDKPLIVDIEAS
ncbi:MAG: hypothetical protein V4443_02680 [Pseudomonadota bacterium]